MPLLNIISEGNVSSAAQTYARRVMYKFPEPMLNAFSKKKWSLVIIDDDIGFPNSGHFKNCKDYIGLMDPFIKKLGVLESVITEGYEFERDDVIQHEFAHFLFYEYLSAKERLFLSSSYYRNLHKFKESLSEDQLQRFIRPDSEKLLLDIPQTFPMHKYFITRKAAENDTEYFSECLAAYFNEIPRWQENLLTFQISAIGRPKRGIDSIMPTKRRLRRMHPEMIPFIELLLS